MATLILSFLVFSASIAFFWVTIFVALGLVMFFRSAPLFSKTRDGDTVIVTGARTGIGLAVADQLHFLGFRVVRLTRNEVDFSRPDALEKMERIVEQTERVVGVFNAAGVSHKRPTPFEHDSRSIEIANTNVTSVIVTTYSVLKKFPTATVVNIGSALGKIPAPYLSSYAASKAFVRQFSRSLQREGKTVKLIEPFLVSTRMTGLRPGLFCPPADVFARSLVSSGRYLPHRFLELLYAIAPCVFDIVVRRISERLVSY
ncbi:FabG-like 3-oxoacyl-(acyl-carrier-protein) reductase [Diadromus pulchellus ascovirus 4a]|uniref:Complete DpAV4 genome n=1 Tax=Diadromus pulchellus ascovirus 4a TaxID=158683 RepID=F2NZ12_9VIRU|nr:FabG-like 3-oxoacyl-(acyl-carrier-protein) reductase [Diadromus pulchellus ascovirus 4a]CCA61440.1 unnamed protein product [Diadromus pulchellus ascovirus 4a]